MLALTGIPGYGLQMPTFSSERDQPPAILPTATATVRVERYCSKVGCTTTATSTLLFEYANSTAWLHDLTPESEPSGYDLCTAHAERMSVPRGWDRVDRRSSTPPLFVARGAAAS